MTGLSSNVETEARAKIESFIVICCNDFYVWRILFIMRNTICDIGHLCVSHRAYGKPETDQNGVFSHEMFPFELLPFLLKFENLNLQSTKSFIDLNSQDWVFAKIIRKVDDC